MCITVTPFARYRTQDHLLTATNVVWPVSVVYGQKFKDRPPRHPRKKLVNYLPPPDQGNWTFVTSRTPKNAFRPFSVWPKKWRCEIPKVLEVHTTIIF